MAAAPTLPHPHTSPRILQPSTFSTTNRPLTPSIGLSSIANQLGPQKEWTLPPRPKPGRKPASNAPPTKRKAQNREAQRAFRERRAAKVGKLEDQMRQMGEDVAQEQEDMRDQIKKLHEDIENWKNISEGWRRECEKVQSILDSERQSKQHLELQVQIMRENPDVSTGTVALKPRAHRAREVPDEHQDETTQKREMMEGLTCGNCNHDSRCQCIEDAFEINDLATSTADHGRTKRTLSPQNSRDPPKRARPHVDDIEEPTEVDFTTRKPLSLRKEASSSSEPVVTATVDSCGFCQDGTTCICAEINRHNENERVSQQEGETLTSPTRKQISNYCTNDPGSCAQCQAIPESKTFCTSLAASRTIVLDTNDGQPNSSRTTERTLNCADAFNRLAQHPNFQQASTQLKTWVPQLATRAIPSTSASDVESRPAFEIEAASVMNVLKVFDVRFGEQQRKKGE